MRGDDDLQEGIFSYISPEKRVPADHPLRPIRKMVDEIDVYKRQLHCRESKSLITSHQPSPLSNSACDLTLKGCEG